ncbi:hypothetical protein HMPREF9137_0616 [Prevotella denticola F0289]|nr:hypothetical protein HMPREF9137_0616 [Prevotella denticola F0289]
MKPTGLFVFLCFHAKGQHTASRSTACHYRLPARPPDQRENPLRGEKKKPTPTWSIGSSTLVCYEKFERIETSQPLLV